MCNDRNCFISFKRLQSPIIIKLGDETIVTTTNHGLINISQDLQLNALYTPMFWLSLLSIHQLDLAWYTTTYRRGICSIFTDSTNIISNRTGDLHILQSRSAPNYETSGNESTPTKKSSSTTELTSASIITMRLRHQPLAHLHPAAMGSPIDGFNDLDATGMCDVCLQAKHNQKFVRTEGKRITWPFELVYSDTCSPFSIRTIGGHLHYILFIEDYTWRTAVYLLSDQNMRLASPPISTTKQRLMEENTTSSVVGATMVEENSKIGSSDSCWPLVVQPSSSFCLMPTITTESQREWFVLFRRKQELWYLTPRHHLSSRGKQSTLQYISINAYQTKDSPKETNVTDIKLLTKLHTRCCIYMANKNTTSRPIIPHERKTVTKFNFNICADLDATSADLFPKSREPIKSLGLDQQPVWWLAMYRT